MKVSRCVYNTQENSQAIKDQKLFFTEYACVNRIKPETRVGDKPGNQSLPRNFYALF